MKRILSVVEAAAYVFGAAFLVAKFVPLGLWSIICSLVIPLPVAFFAGTMHIAWVSAVIGYVLLNVELLIVSTAFTPSESFYVGAAQRAWFTPIIYVAVYSLLLCAVNAVPALIAFLIGVSKGNKKQVRDGPG